MPLLIDTYNVLHTVGVLPPELAGTDIANLIRLLQSSRYRDEPTTLVCDGSPDLAAGEKAVSRTGPITIRFSGKGRSADDLIAQLIRASTAPRRLIVVSSDHAVIRTARRRRARTMTSEEFLTELANDAAAADSSIRLPAKKPSGGMSEAQIEKWVNVFKIDEQTMSITSRTSQTDASAEDDAPAASELAASPEQAKAPPPPHTIKKLGRGEGLPMNVIEQAERMWKQEQARRTQSKPEES